MVWNRIRLIAHDKLCLQLRYSRIFRYIALITEEFVAGFRATSGKYQPMFLSRI